MNRVLKYDKKFLVIHTQIICILIIYLLFHLFSNSGLGDLLFYIAPIILLYIVNIVFYLLRYYDRRRYFFGVKYVNLFLLCYLLYNSNLFISGTAILFYLLICMELILTLTIEKKSNELILYILVVIPVIIGAVIMLKQDLLQWNNMFFVIQFITVQIGLSIIVSINNKDLREKIEAQTKLWEEAERTNEELSQAQFKLKQINDQMSIQKEEMETANKQLNMLTAEMYTQNELLLYISSVLDISELMEVVTDAIIGAIGVDTCLMVIYDNKSNTYHYNVKSNHPGNYTERFKKSLKAGLLDNFFKDGKTFVDNNVENSKYPFNDDRPVGSMIVIPLIKGNNTYGLIIAEHEKINMFSKNNTEFFKGITTQINIAINNANLYAQMEEMAIRDGLTGLYNRKYTQSYISDLINKEQSNVITIALMDIDKFKNINDTYGHLFGDKAIIMVANTAKKYAQEYNGIAGRYGGEEFVIVFPNKTINETMNIVSRLHEDIKSHSLTYNNSQTVNLNVSIGVTSYPDQASTTEELLQRADNAMYYSKEHGRGRITFDSKDIK